MAPYKVLDWDRSMVSSGSTEAYDIERLLNNWANNGFELDRFEDLPDGNSRRFYFKKP